MKTLIIGTDFQSAQNLKTQGQFLKDALEKNAVPVAIVSKHRNYLRRILDTISQLLKLRRKDTVIVQVYSTKGIYLECLSVLIARVKGCRVISTLHGGDIPNQYHTNSTKRILLNLIFKYSDEVTAPSAYIPEQIPVIRDQFSLIRNIIDLSQYSFQPNINSRKIRILWMRAYHVNYDPLKAIQVVEYLLEHNHDVEMIMAGSDLGLKIELEQYIGSRACSTKIKLLDVINNPQKNELAAVSSMYLCTNKIDNAPVSFLEMMAMGIPVVSTNIGGIPYYVTDQKTALLSSDNSINNIAETIIKLHNDDMLRTNIITNGQDFVKAFSADIVSRKWISLINQTSKRTD